MDAYESYRRLVEADSAGASTPDVAGDPYRYVPEVFAAWLGRYRRQQAVIDSIDDAELKRSVTMRGIHVDMAQTELPDWTDVEWRVIEMAYQNKPKDLPMVTGLHAYGPSLRALWTEAKRGGASHADAWLHIVAWARRPPSRGDFVPEVFAQPVQPEPPPARVFNSTPGLRLEQLLPRYLAGEREQVWEHMMSLGPYVREPSFQPHVSSVVTETMQRARRNVERLVASLRGVGYQFWDGLDVMDTSPTMKMAYGGRVITIPNITRGLRRKEPRGRDHVLQPADVDDLTDLALPMSVEAWFREVGNVDFSGRHPELCHFDNDPEFRGVHADPLVFFLEPVLIEETPSGDYLALSMDAEGKAGQASAAQMDGFYSVRVPDVAADGILYGVPGQRTFVEYLRESFAWAGFPGWRVADGPPLDLIETLTRDLEPI